MLDVEEVMELPASTINFWKSYFSIYPFSWDAADLNAARLMDGINNIVPKRYYKNAKSFLDFLPVYVDDGKVVELDREQQRIAAKAFRQRLAEAKVK